MFEGATLTVFAAEMSATSFGTSSPGSLSLSVSPKRSCSRLAKMMTAIPAVQLTVTGYGMNLTKVPSLK